MKTLRAAGLLLATLLLAAATSQAKDRVWRCTDAQGRTVYQDSACASAGEARTVQATDPRDATAVAEGKRRAAAEQALGEKLAQERREAERKAMLQRPIHLAGPTAAAASANARSKSNERDKVWPQPQAKPAGVRPAGSLQRAGSSAN